MTVIAEPAPAAPRLRSGLLVCGFALCVVVRVVLGGQGPARSPFAGLVFAGLLLALAAAARTAVPVSVRALASGMAAGLLLCLPVAVSRLGLPFHPTDGFAMWAGVVGIVAVAEEVFLRGTLYDAVADGFGAPAAIAVGALAFALLHVPLYGWHVVPLDLVVGVVLGELRRSTGTAAAPAAAHTTADLLAWFLR
ncbi:MAG: Type prenyl endopeptidase Rce1-like [Actinomycetota bacterium]|nr:Type prenyl endopeptidase Rce1-like [Actinomycetota bacterium]